MRRKIISMLYGNGFYALSQLISFVVIARYFNGETLGVYAYSIALSVPLYMVGNLGYRSLFATDYREKYNPGYFLLARLFLSSIIFGLLIAYGFFYFELMEFLLIYYCVIALKFIDSNFDMLIGVKQREEKFGSIGFLNVLRSILYVVPIAIGAILKFELFLILSFVVVVWLVFYIYFSFGYISNRQRSSGDFFQLLVKVSVISFPFGLIPLLASVNLNFPRLAIEYYMGYEALAQYSIMYQLVFLGTVGVTAVGQAILPRLANLYGENKLDQWRSLIKKLFIVLALLSVFYVVLVGFFGNAVVKFIFGSQYDFQAHYLVCMVVLGCFSYVLNLLSYAIQSVGNFKNVSIISVCITVAHFLLIAMLVPYFGVLGAIFGSIAYFAMYILLILTRLGSVFWKSEKV